MKREFESCKIKKSCYKTMVKAGEVYYTSHDNDIDKSEKPRPRNIMIGGRNNHGFITYIQDVMHKIMKRALPGYIQASDKQ